MECRKCGREIEEGHKMCLNCGSAVDFEEVADESKQEEQIEQIIKKKPIQKLSRQMLGGVLMFIIACLCVGIAMSYTSKTLNMYMTDPADLPTKTTETTKAEVTETQPFTPAAPIINDYEVEYRQFPLKIIGFSAKEGKAGMPKLYVSLENISKDYTINEITLRVIAFDETGKRVAKNNSESGKYIDFKFKNQKLKSGKTLQDLELVPVGFEKGVNFRITIMSAQSTDGYTYENMESALIWKKADVTKE